MRPEVKICRACGYTQAEHTDKRACRFVAIPEITWEAYEKARAAYQPKNPHAPQAEIPCPFCPGHMWPAILEKPAAIGDVLDCDDCRNEIQIAD